MEDEEDEGKAWRSSKKEDEGEVVQLVGVGLQHPLAMLRRGGGASMMGESVELLHGLGLEREGEGSE